MAAAHAKIGEGRYVEVSMPGGIVLQARSDALRFEFIVAEIDLAITFCETAASTRDPARIRRNIERATEAYATAKHFVSGGGISKAMLRTIQRKTSELESLLREVASGNSGDRAGRKTGVKS